MTDQCLWLEQDRGVFRRCRLRPPADAGFCEEHLKLPAHDRQSASMAVDRADFGPGQVLRAVRSEDTDDEKLYIECGQMAVVLDVTFIAAPDTRFDNRDWDPALETCESLLEALENDEHLAYLTERSGDPFHNVVPRMRLKFIDTYTGRIAVSSFTDACCAFEEVSKVDKYEMQELNRLASPFELLARQADGLCDE